MYTHSKWLTITCLRSYSKQERTKIPKLSRRTHSTEDVYTGQLTRQEVSLVQVSSTSPHRWLCLEDSQPRRQRLGLVGTGSPKSTIDFSLSLSTKMGSSEDMLGQGWSTLSAVPHVGSREPAVCGERFAEDKGSLRGSDLPLVRILPCPDEGVRARQTARVRSH